MYLKNLTVLGFKSFADKTSLNFQPGITAIVGPNGCGKSNVADAIRWVLGEQSAKALRGGEMADVIFTGTDHRKPLGMAEVSLTVGDIDGEHLKAAGVEIAYNEVTITRRVFRDGGSEYFLNKTPCRLKDIQQLFMGTGVGRTSYSIMAQGNITQIISSKPEDRRLVFEEAAGITKFKAQKKEALRKLDHTEQNLLRVADLIREVKRQIGSLQRQAGKARRYKQLQQELQHLDTQLARHQFDLFQAEIWQKEEALRALSSQIETHAENVAAGEREISQLRSLLSELDQQIHHAQQRGHELKSQIERHDSRIHLNTERLAELQSQNEKALQDIAQASERKTTGEQELQGLSERLAASSAALDQHRTALLAKQGVLSAIEKELQTEHEQLRRAQSEAFAAAQQLGRIRNQITALDLQKQGNIVRLEKLSAEKIQLEEERNRLEARLQEFASNVEVDQRNVQSSRGTVEQRQERLRELQQELAQAGQQLDQLHRQQAEKRSRLNVLEQLQAEHEGFSSGTLAALKGAQHVLGSLADKIRVPDQYVVAIETALGHHLQLVLTEHPEAAQEILADLSANKRGRASIAPLSLLDARGAASTAPAQLPSGSATEGLVSALDVVEADPAVAPLVRGLLGQTMIVPDLVTGTAAWRQSLGQFDFVTSTGELLNRHGIYTGGSGNNTGKPSTSVLARKNQIADLREAVEELQEQVNERSRRKGALQSEQTLLQSSLQQAQQELRSQEVAIATRQGEFNALQSSLRQLHQKIDTVVYEIQSLAGQEGEGTRKRDELSAQVGSWEEQEGRWQEAVSTGTGRLELLRQERERAQAALSETKVSLAGEEQLAASLRQQEQTLSARVQELTQLIARRQEEIGSFVSRRTQAEEEMEESRRRIATLQHDREQVNIELTELVSIKERQERDVSEREDRLRDIRRQLSDVQQRRGGFEVELAQKTMSVANLRQRVLEKYQIHLDDVRSECITITLVDSGQAKVQTLTPDEMAAAGVATDWNVVSEEVAALQKRIEEMGPVNLVAIEEYEETEQRYKFLSSQHDDLVQAKGQLVEVINRINAQTQEMFADTFARIRENFRTLFVEIFGGGKADLQLVDEGDVLESGIEIVARPPGKQLQSISLLSGGEQTMTAVALLFAIYQVKPSPFCVLDELDAPLDESNINRFIRILQRFLTDSQFVIITHNKRTIGMANILYGVTMEEHGVSKIVSVKFHKAGDEIQPGTAVPLVPPPAVAPVDAEEDQPQKRSDTLEVVVSE